MRRFWDARAAEDPFYFVDNRLTYRDADLERFWVGGREILDRTLTSLGVEIAPGDEIVEIGCGVGRITRPLAERAGGVRALDVSPRMLELARELNPRLENVNWILGDGESLAGIASGSADVVYSFVVFQHIPDPEVTLAYVREMGRVLRPGGWAALQVSNDPRVHQRPSLQRRIARRLRALLARGPRGQSHDAWLGSAVGLDRLRAVAREAEMDAEHVVGAGTQHCLVLLRRRAR
jgi:SAM-dependent methyltransferase